MHGRKVGEDVEFTPRLIQILFLLLNAKSPISAGKLAEQLQISKRTIFRELNYVDASLGKYGLKLERKSGIGFELTGDLQKKQELLEELKNSDHFDPRNREERQKKLMLSIMQEDRLQKLFYYADMLKVSEPTVSKDLEVIEEWFQRQNIMLLRKAGFGVGLVYREEDFRKALLAYASQYQDRSFLKCVYNKIQELIKELGNDIVNKLTNNSVKNFTLYTAISIQRIQNKKYLADDMTTYEVGYPQNYEFICTLAKAMEEEFEIIIPKEEIYGLYVFLQGCKYQYIQREGECIYIGNEQINIKNMVYEMSNVFDPKVAYELKDDVDFMEGMIAHLQPTITRLVHGIPIKNPLLQQIKDSYPEVFVRAKKASEVMNRILSCRTPEDEIGFLALHFGGAMMRLDAKKKSRKIVNIGVVCSNGIGISMLLSSKLRHHFGDLIQVSVVETRNISNAQVDFLVSIFPIETELENICVDPMMLEKDLKVISERIEFYAWREKKESKQMKKDQDHSVYEATLIVNEINSIVKEFRFERMSCQITFLDALREISGYFTEDHEQQEEIYKDLSEREALSTQVIEEFELVFFHARTTAVEESKFIIVLPDDEFFKDPYFKKAKVMIVMLIPKEDPRATLAVSSISTEIFEDEELLEQIKSGEEEIVFEKVKDILEQYFDEYLRMMYEEKQ